MDYFPVFMKLQDQPVLVVGGGNVAERKIRLLLDAGAVVFVVARELNSTCEEWLADNQITLLAREYRRELLGKMRLAFAATNDELLNQRVFRDGEDAGVLVNVVDSIEHCRFISPAVIDRSPVQIAISTGGAAPALARRLRSLLEAQLPLSIGPLARAAGSVRKKIRDLVPSNRVRLFWDQQLSKAAVRSHRTELEIQRGLLEAARKFDAGSAGKVFLVGAGPGRPDLLTLRALQVLGQADVILHDRLVPEAVLELARRDAERIDVGKRAGSHHKTQAEIHKLMLEYAALGRNVVRLKGGDPFMFGRGGEELEILRDHGIEYEVVPGITAAIACGAYSGIPLTHREHSAVVSFVTGHSAANENLDWASLAGPGKTLAIYMGVKQARKIRSQMLRAGIDAGTPAALITNGSTDTQQTVISTLGDLPSMALKCNPKSPGLFIIGQVASLGSNLAWFNIPVAMAEAA